MKRFNVSIKIKGMNNEKKIGLLFVILIYMAIAAFFIMLASCETEKQYTMRCFEEGYDSISIPEEVVVEEIVYDFTDANINAYLCDTSVMLDMLEKHDIKCKRIVLKQAVWESGWFKCTDCSMRYNNPFGFRYPTWVDEKNPKGYIKFKTIENAVKYYKKWQDKHYKGGNYYQFLIDRHYAHDSEKYVKHLKSLSI